jgi:short-subunit dehydrogenase
MGNPRPVALVTGASSGIGEVFARRLSAAGCHVLVVARRRDRLEQLAAELGNAEAIVADLTENDDLHALEQRLADEPCLEYVVNNAGFGSVGYFFQTDREEQDRMHRLHVLATMRLTHAAVAGMIARKKGTIINVSSVAAFFHNPFNVTYGATKAWINSFTEALFVELQSLNSPVRVQALCPGFTYTEFHDVLGVERRAVPKGFWMTAEAVVETSLRALQKDRVIVIPGWRYRLIVRIQQILPRAARLAIALHYGARNRRPAAISGVRS